ncbi:hypothetical protein P885DRAFT_80691 [Corynascus similis CBS 632.67]
MGLLESSSDHGSVRSTNFNDVSSAFCAMLNDERFLATCFIVEAIDECSLNGDEAEAERGMNDLLSLISTTIRLSNKVKWLVSLDSAVAQKRMKAMEHGDWPLHLNLDSYSDALRPAVLEHIGSKVETLLHPTSYVQDDRNSQDLRYHPWAWVPWNTLHILDELPVGVEALYTYAKEAINRLPMDDHVYCNKVLDTVAVAYRPLRVSELVDMANLPPIVDPTIAIAKCSVFLQVHEDEVSVVHQSAKEFLRNKMESPLKVHAEIIGFCLKHLSKEFTTTASTKRTSSEQPAHYATLYWLQHLSVVLDDGLEGKTKTIDAVAWFLDKHFLQWIETLPPFSGIPQVLIQMSILEDKLRVFCGQRVGLPWPLEVALLADRAPNHYIKELSMMMAREARNEAQGVRRVVFYEQI